MTGVRSRVAGGQLMAINFCVRIDAWQYAMQPTGRILRPRKASRRIPSTTDGALFVSTSNPTLSGSQCVLDSTDWGAAFG